MPLGGFAGLLAAGVRWLTSKQFLLQASRQRSGMVDAGFLVQELGASLGGGLLAGPLALRQFLFLVPLVYVVFTVRARHPGPAAENMGRRLAAGIYGAIITAAILGTAGGTCPPPPARVAGRRRAASIA